MIANLFFWLFSSIIVISSIAVISARNPVHSVLFLILAFANSSGLFVLLGAEFLAMIFLIVYVGAVAVLFLFVVMMLNIDLESISLHIKKYIYSGLVVGFILLIELILSGYSWDLIKDDLVFQREKAMNNITNTQQIGNVMYTEYFLLFQIAGSILLVAMIGAIVFTLRNKEGVIRQNISQQVNRRREDSITLVDINVPTKDKLDD